MDPIQTGAWIAALRKEKCLTQKDLAQRLRVTDKAVSRWETGKGYPDVSLLPALADELGCTVNDLLSGKRLTPEEVPAAAEENLTALCRTAGQPLPNERRLFDDSRVEVKEDRIVIRWGFRHVFIVWIFLMMVVIGGLLAGKLVQGSGDWKWDFPDLIGVVFFCVWLLGSAALLITVILTRTSTLTIDRDGVTLKRPVGTKALCWEQLRDYGVAYSHRDRALLYYELYFSDTVLSENERGEKKPQKTTVRIDLSETLMDRYICGIMDLCEQNTSVTPFLVHPYDRLRFQGFGRNRDAQTQEPEKKKGRLLPWAAVGAFAAGLLFFALDRLLFPQGRRKLLSMIGGTLLLTVGIAVLWADFHRLRRAGKQNKTVEEIDWTEFLQILIVGLLTASLGVVVLILCLQNS